MADPGFTGGGFRTVISLVPRLSNYCAVMRGREREPGIHCKFTRLISREFYGFVNSPYSFVNDDASARTLVYSAVYTRLQIIVRKRCQHSELYRQYLLRYVTATDVRSEAYGSAAASYSHRLQQK